MAFSPVKITNISEPSRERQENILPETSSQKAEEKVIKTLAEVQREEIFVFPTPQKQRQRQDTTRQQRWFMVTDALALLLGFVCAWGLAALINQVYFDRHLGKYLAEGDALRLAQFLIIAAGVMLWFEHTNHYRVRIPFWMETKKIIGTLSFAMLIDGFIQFASKEDFSRLWLVSGWVFSGIAMVSLRSFYRRLLHKQGRWQVPALLVGRGTTAEEACAALSTEPALGYNIVAQISDLPRALHQAEESWEKLCSIHGADYVLLALDGPDLARAEVSIAQLMREDVPFSIVPPLWSIPVAGMVPQYFFNHDVILMTRSSGLEQPLQRFIKRGFDILVSGMALLIAGPFMLIIAALVKLDGGPVLFGQLRPGLNGRLFKCLKFRSMIANADEALEHYLKNNLEAREEYRKYHKLRNDPRVTRVGAILRRYSLDELPQLINVLKGDMSLVGPRPILMAEKIFYSHDIAHYYKVRPGITGLWQVSGRNNVTFSRRVKMESWYVRNWSLWHDIAILCKTIPVLFRKTGAY